MILASITIVGILSTVATLVCAYLCIITHATTLLVDVIRWASNGRKMKRVTVIDGTEQRTRLVRLIPWSRPNYTLIAVTLVLTAISCLMALIVLIMRFFVTSSELSMAMSATNQLWNILSFSWL